MRVPSTHNVGSFGAGHRHAADRSTGAPGADHGPIVEETAPGTSPRRERQFSEHQFAERRSSENLANAQALRLGLAAQMLTTQPVTGAIPPLPLSPSARGAARYATTALGVDQAIRLGFIRTI